MREGLELWRMAAARASQVPELASTEAYMLAQGALDRALTENCTVALEMVNEVRSLPMGPVARFNAGMAAALCGDQTYAEKTIAGLEQSFPRSSMVTQYDLPELQAAAALGVSEPGKALQALSDDGAHDQLSLKPYLRGLAHAAMGQREPAIADFQTVLGHWGAVFLLRGSVYPMAEFGLARAYMANGDKVDGVAAYQRFNTLWEGADRTQPHVIEALAKGR
jgi:eukaryotic-like serine/threonine-protein kinase